MEREGVIEKVMKYLYESNLSVSEISQDLGIPIEKLQFHADEPMTATEFLVLCQYLGIRPEEFR